MLKFKYYQDPGHGWVAVKKDFVKKIGLLEKISQGSYQKGNTLYLEEDLDAQLVLNTLKTLNIPFELVSKSINKSSPIRSYSRKTNE